MGIPVFFIMTIFIVFIIQSSVARSNRSEKKDSEDYLSRERESNMTPRKDLSTLNFITIPGNLASHSDDMNAEIKACREEIAALSEKKIVNLTGISNTDLKLTYGTANLPLLSEYDENYARLARVLNKYGRLLRESGDKDRAAEILEFAISTGTDISESYINLALIYKDAGRVSDIDNLLSQAQALNSMTGASLVRSLSEIRNEA